MDPRSGIRSQGSAKASTGSRQGASKRALEACQFGRMGETFPINFKPDIITSDAGQSQMKKRALGTLILSALVTLSGCSPVRFVREHYVCDGAVWREADGGKTKFENAVFGFKIERYNGISGSGQSTISLILPDRDSNDPVSQFGYYGTAWPDSNLKIEENGIIADDGSQSFIFSRLTQTLHYKRGSKGFQEHFNGKCRMVEPSKIWTK